MILFDVERLEASHLAEIRDRAVVEMMLGVDQLLDFWPHYKNGDGFIGRYDGDVVVASGVMNLWPGVGEAWALFTPEAQPVRRVISRHFKRMFDLVIIANGYHRVQASVRADFTAGIRFAEWLGFEEEGVMKRYDAEQNDYLRMARIGS